MNITKILQFEIFHKSCQKQWYFTTPRLCLLKCFFLSRMFFQCFSMGALCILKRQQHWTSTSHCTLSVFSLYAESSKNVQLLVKHSAHHCHYLSVQSQWRRDGTNATSTNHHILLIPRLNKREDCFSPNSLYQINFPTSTNIGMKNNTWRNISFAICL